MLKNMYQSARRNGGKIMAIALVGLLTGCTGPAIRLFDGKIDGQRVVYYEGSAIASDFMEIYSGGKLNKTIKDWNENGIIGDHVWDEYVLILDEDKKITYMKNLVIDENGREFKGDDQVSKKALEIGKKKLEEATQTYNDLKKKICEILETKLK